jgi:hypothetical protein
MSRCHLTFACAVLASVGLTLPAQSASSTSSSSAASRSSAATRAAPAISPAPATRVGPGVASPTSTGASPGATTITSPGSTTSTAGAGTAVVTTSPSTSSSTSATTGTGGGRTSTPNLSAFNPGTQDQNAPADPNEIQSPTGAPGSTTTVTGTPTPTTGDQILGANGVQLPNVGMTTSGAVPGQVATTNRGEVDASGGGTARPDPGATGRNMPECMSAWDAKTHITKLRWRQICARTLTEPHI